MKARKGILFVVGCFRSSICGCRTDDTRRHRIDAEVAKIMTHTRAEGMAVAVIDHGKVGYVQSYGIRNAKGDPLKTGHRDVRCVAHKNCLRIHRDANWSIRVSSTLDTPIGADLDKLLLSYGPDPVFPDGYPYNDLADDPRLGEDYSSHVFNPLCLF